MWYSLFNYIDMKLKVAAKIKARRFENKKLLNQVRYTYTTVLVILLILFIRLFSV